MTQQYSAWRTPQDDPDSPSPTTGSGRAPGGAPVYPTIPQGSGAPPPAVAAAAAPRLMLVALISALIGGLLAGGTLLLAGDRRPPAEVAGGDDTSAVQTATVETSGEPTQVEAVAEVVLPTVVQLDINGSGGAGQASGNGSGVVYRSDGHIITNNHVVENARQIEVVFSDGETANGEVVGRDPLSDIAVVKVDREGLAAIQIGEADDLRVGQLAVAVGSPFGLEGSVTAGVISALNRPISVGNGIRIPNVIQTDAPINPGNSGGALVGADGRLIGINSAILTAGSPANAGVGFAVPVDLAVETADELIASGAVDYPFLGVEGSDVTSDIADRLGVERGAFIDSVRPDTPAAEAGLRAGDVVVDIGGTPIASMDDLILAIRRADIGETVEITYRRGGSERTTEVTLEQRPDDL